MSAYRQKLKPAEAAVFLGLKPSTLAKMRVEGTGPIFSKLGHKVVVYDPADLEAWVMENKRTSTSSPAK